MSSVAFLGAVEQGLIYALLALGIMISYRILNIADLTVEGSFTTGAAVSAVMTAAGHPVWGVFLAMAASAGAGIVSALLQTKMRVQPILAGILTMTALYSVNLRIMGGAPNTSLLRMETIFTPFQAMYGSRYGKLILILLILAAASILVDLFFRTQVGLSVRATGDNEEMVRSSSINSDFTKALGLAVSGSMVGLSGAVIAQYQAFADVSMGVGIVVVALASLIIGEVLLGRRSVTRGIASVALGAVAYRLILTAVLSANLKASDLKLISAVIVAIAISYPAVKQQWQVFQLKKKAGACDAEDQ